MRKYTGRFCERFYCTARKFNACCRDCYIRNRGCMDACKNSPEACGFLGDDSRRICGAYTGLYRLIPTIAADPNRDPYKHKREEDADVEAVREN